MSQKLHIDIETYSSVDILTAGAYRYCESIDFEILILCYAFDKGPIQTIDLLQGEQIPQSFFDALMDPKIEKHAHNANFERNGFRAIGYNVPIDQWFCSAIKAGYCGLPLGLGAITDALDLQEDGKLATGKALIRFFSGPIKPTKKNDRRFRNFPNHDPEKWAEYKKYCGNDVKAERKIGEILKNYTIGEIERKNYILDQEINDRGILIDIPFAKNAYELDQINSQILGEEMKKLTGLENPNSPKQLKNWLGNQMQTEIMSLAKGEIPTLIKLAGPGVASDVLNLRSRASKTSIKKYVSMQNCVCYDGRAHGLFQFYGASRTGRWAGRLIQLQNLPQNHLAELATVREAFKYGEYEDVSVLYPDVSSTLSQLIRTAFIAKKDHTFAVADFSAIEARVIAWLANETWRMDVFNSHGKIYEASASQMFGIPIEKIDKTTEEGAAIRGKGKVAELALGYQGALGALKQMGGEAMGLSDVEMDSIVKSWREKSPMIVRLWKSVEGYAIRAIKNPCKKYTLELFKNLVFEYDGVSLTIQLPSGRKLFYHNPRIKPNKWGRDAVQYKGTHQVTRKWGWIDSYGGKFTENIVQAIARDLLAYSMLRLNDEGFKIVMHVHDEAVCEVPTDDATDDLQIMCDIMGEEVPWAKGSPLVADGYITPFYKKD
jgi:DNA polymerase